MEKARKSKWTVNTSVCVCALLYHILRIHETGATVASERKSAGSDERAALDQALLLVQLLRSGSRKTVTTHPPATPFQPWNNRRVAGTYAAGMYGADMFQHRRRWRPPAYYYNDDPIGEGKWRRFDYGDFLGSQPGINETRRTASADYTTTITTVSEPPSRITTRSIETTKGSKYNMGTSPTTTSVQTVTATNAMVTTAETEAVTEKNTARAKTFKSSDIHTTSSIVTFVTIKISVLRPVMKKLLPFSRKASKSKVVSSTHIKEPEWAQAAAELAKELGVCAAVGRSGMGQRFPLRRGSTKLFLAASTRYPLPLPENHAFCYTNPHSALCRTLV